MKVHLLVPHHTGSHAAWAAGLVRCSRHNISLLTLTGFFWKWRIHGGAVTMARMVTEQGHSPDLILATDMLDPMPVSIATIASWSRSCVISS